jgi:hypothetical protein
VSQSEFSTVVRNTAVSNFRLRHTSVGRIAWDGLQFGARRSQTIRKRMQAKLRRIKPGAPQANARSLVPNRPVA